MTSAVARAEFSIPSLEDAIGPFARALSRIDIAVATELDFKETDDALEHMEATFQKSAATFTEGLAKFKTALFAAGSAEAHYVDGLIEQCLEGERQLKLSRGGLVRVFRRLERITTRPLPKTYRLFKPRFDRAESMWTPFFEVLQDVVWDL